MTYVSLAHRTASPSFACIAGSPLDSGGLFTGVLDLASNSTAGNWLAARDLDVTSMAQGQPSSYPRETGRSRPLMCAQFDTVRHGFLKSQGFECNLFAIQALLAVKSEIYYCTCCAHVWNPSRVNYHDASRMCGCLLVCKKREASSR